MFGDLFDTLALWNRWGSNPLVSGLRRDVTASMRAYLETPEVVGLIGPRRAGKTTVLFQVMDDLRALGVPDQAMLHLNLEEPALSTQLGVALLDEAYETWRRAIWPTGRAFVFLDEVQHVPEWERWVRARAARDGLKAFVTGSSSALLSRELGTLLTGRHVSFRVMPLSFPELLRFQGLDVPTVPTVRPEPPVDRALDDYLRWGGFPEVVLAQDTGRKERLLREYFDDVLYKDVALRHSVRDLPALRALAVALLTETSGLVSWTRMAARFGLSQDLVRAYATYLEEAFVVRFLPYYSLKAAERQRRPQKVHAVDLGLRNAVALTGSPDCGRLIETAVANELAREPHDGVYYWKGDHEVDLVVRSANDVARLVQVTQGDDPTGKAMPRELQALQEGGAAFPSARRELVTRGVLPQAPAHVSTTPLWRFLCKPDASSSTASSRLPGR